MSVLETVLANIEGKMNPDFSPVEISVEGLDTGYVLHVKGKEQISTLFSYEVEVELDGPPPDLTFVIGGRAALTVRDVTGQARVIVGIVTDIHARSFDASTHRAVLTMRPAVFRQFLGRDCYALQEVSTVQVLKDVLEDYPGKIRYELSRDYPTYPYKVQYREDDWTYVSRLCEEEGIYYWFDHEGDDSAVVFADTSEAAPPIEGIPVINYAEPSSMRPDQEAVVEVSFQARMASGKFSGRSFDPDRPLMGISSSDGESHREDYDAPGAGPVEPAILERRIKDAKQAAEAARRGISGIAITTRMTPGRTFVMIGHPLVRLNGEFLITSVEVEAHHKKPSVTRFTAIPKDLAFRPLRTTPQAKQVGIQMGKVTGPSGAEVHPDARGRVRTQLHWDRRGNWNEKSGTWMRIAQRGAPGSMLLPRMGWNVTTFNEEGGVDVPSILNRIHDAEHPPAYGLPDNMTRVVFKTPTIGGGEGGTAHNEIYFEDAHGRQEMFINASKDMNKRVRHGANEAIDNDSLHEVGATLTMHIDAQMSEKIGQNQNYKIGGNLTMEVQDVVAKEVTGSETRSIGGNLNYMAGDSVTQDVKKNKQLSIGGSLNEISFGDITEYAVINTSKVVGGILGRISGQSLTDQADKHSIQVVGGAKVESAKKERTTNVKKRSFELVGGSLKCKAKKEFKDNADNLQEIKVSEEITAKGKSVHVEAEKTLRVKCGNSAITLTKDGITFEGTGLSLSGGSVDSNASKISHN